jgi:glycosyltransferase involved in cell wall biosynthesis
MEGNSTWGTGSVEEKDGYRIYRPSKLIRLAKLFLPTSYPRDAFRFSAYPGTVSLANYVKELVIKNDIRLVSAYHIFSAGLASAMVCRELSVPLITSIFGEIYSQPEMHKKRLLQVKYVIDASNKLLSCSEHCAKSFATIGLHPEVEAVYYGIDTNLFTVGNSPHIMRNKLGIGIKDKVVIFVGRMVREMGLHVLLEAIPGVLVKDEKVRFLIVGRSGELLEAARKVVFQFPKNVFVIPDAPFDELPFYYSASTLAVIPSINDRACLGLAIAEAMATGKPVIVTNVGGGPEVVSDGESGCLVPPENSNALIENILELLKVDDGALQHMGQLGRERAVAVFDNKATNRRMEQIFIEHLINE